MILRLNLGCNDAPNPTPDDWVRVDCRRLPGVDLVWDLNRHPWPWADASVDAVYARYVIEHLAHPLAAMLEIRRILKPGGSITVIVPHADSFGAYSVGHFSRFRRQWFLDLDGKPDCQNDPGRLFAHTRVSLHPPFLDGPTGPAVAWLLRQWDRWVNARAGRQLRWEMSGIFPPADIEWHGEGKP